MKTPFVTLALAAALAAGGTAHAASHALSTFITEQDLDKDGTVAKEEYKAGRDARFAATDLDKNGGLSHDEYVGEYAARLNARLPSVPAAGREDEKTRQMRQVEVRFGVLDSNKDGKISPAEYEYSGWAMFMVHDRDKDGDVSLADDKVPAPPAAN